MTPSLITTVAAKLKPYVGLIVLAVVASVFAVFVLFVAALTAPESLRVPLFFVAWPFFFVASASFGLLISIVLYAQENPTRGGGGRSAVRYWWQRINRLAFAPAITLWFAALVLIFLMGLAIGGLHLAAWLGVI